MTTPSSILVTEKPETVAGAPSAGIEVRGPAVSSANRVLTAGALSFVAMLERRFGGRRRELLARRADRQRDLDAGWTPELPSPSSEPRAGDWTVATIPDDLLDRRV